MSPNILELKCECPRCGKSVHHVIRWLRENDYVKCAGCDNAMLSAEILRDNSRLVQNSDEAERRDRAK
jgi:uncharacterized Zn finger protein